MSNNDVGRHFRQHLEPSGKLLLLTIVMAAAATAAKSDRQTTNFAPLSMNDMGNWKLTKWTSTTNVLDKTKGNSSLQMEKNIAICNR